MWRYFVPLLIFAFLAGNSPAEEIKDEQGKPSEEQKGPPEVVNRKNPSTPSAASIAEGKKLFTIDCAMCHGQEGDGKGELAVTMKLSLRDYRDEIAMKKFSDGELFDVITNGKGGMPAEGKRATTEQVGNLVS